MPLNWATTQNNLGEAYRNRIKGDRGENIEKAIQCYQLALKERRREVVPLDWATTQNNLGNAYQDRIKEDRRENIEKAIECYQLALEVNKPEIVPEDCLVTVRNLGRLAREIENWQLAIDTYQKGIKAVNQVREWVITAQQKQQAMERALDVYENMVYVCVQAQRLDLAISAIESSKSRYLVEAITKAEIMPLGATETQQQQLRDLQNRLVVLKMSLTPLATSPDIPDNQSGRSISVNTPNPEVDRQEQIKQIETEIQQLLNTIGDSDYLNKTTVQTITLAEIQALINPQIAIIEWFITSNGFYTLVITPKQIQYIYADSDTLKQLKTSVNKYLTNYHPSVLAEISPHLKLPQLLNIIPPECEQLILVTHLFLHILPLHALPLAINTRQVVQDFGANTCLQDYFPRGIIYAPSCQLLQRLRQKDISVNNQDQAFFALQNPTEDLIFADLEVNVIQNAFKQKQVLVRQQANKPTVTQKETLAYLNRSNYIHFACHGGFNSASPLDSALALAASLTTTAETERTLTLRDGKTAKIDKCLTLKEIISILKLEAAKLVILSACETCVSRVDDLVDEYISLSVGFIYAGAGNVIGSLRRVDDLATAVTMIRFYEYLHLPQSPTINEAFLETQNWLRRLTKQGLFDWLVTMEIKAESLESLKRYLACYNDPPFAELKYWASFTVVTKEY